MMKDGRFKKSNVGRMRINCACNSEAFAVFGLRAVSGGDCLLNVLRVRAQVSRMH